MHFLSTHTVCHIGFLHLHTLQHHSTSLTTLGRPEITAVMSWNDGGVTNGFTADEASSAWGGGDTSGGVDFTANAGGDVTAEGGFGGDDCCRK